MKFLYYFILIHLVHRIGLAGVPSNHELSVPTRRTATHPHTHQVSPSLIAVCEERGVVSLQASLLIGQRVDMNIDLRNTARMLVPL